jgi:hypothetical protein
MAAWRVGGVSRPKRPGAWGHAVQGVCARGYPFWHTREMSNHSVRGYPLVFNRDHIYEIRQTPRD